jgi:hypothetical protein
MQPVKGRDAQRAQGVSQPQSILEEAERRWRFAQASQHVPRVGHWRWVLGLACPWPAASSTACRLHRNRRTVLVRFQRGKKNEAELPR